MIERALLLTEADLSPEDTHLTGVLDFMGVSVRALPAREFAGQVRERTDDSVQYRLLCSSDTLAKLLCALDTSETVAASWREDVHSVFVWAGQNAGSLQKVLRRLTDDGNASVLQEECLSCTWEITDKLPELCGPMSGLTVITPPIAVANTFVYTPPNINVTEVISSKRGAAFVRIYYQGVPVFVSTEPHVINLDAALTKGNFDIRNHLLMALPAVAYAKWAFPASCWTTPQINACLVIDDPLLRPQYGSLNFRELLTAMTSHNFFTSIAFIPWNWGRNASEVTRLFKDNRDRYSLCIHGCDHTGAEFGSESKDTLAWKAKQALFRMGRLESVTGIPYDRVMVFPQGVFSNPAMDILKRTNYTAAVNTEVISSQPSQAVRISDVWDVAVMNYASFPIFTRRYPAQGVENLAFDILLGKPCLVVIHHQDCRNQLKDLTKFIDGLNGLRSPLSWGSLGDMVRRTYRQREISAGAVEIEMYGLDLELRNPFRERKHFKIRKREMNPEFIQEVRVDSGDVSWTASEGYIHFEADVDSGKNAEIAIRFRIPSQGDRSTETFKYRFKTALRRYLSEVRDNYVNRVMKR